MDLRRRLWRLAGRDRERPETRLRVWVRVAERALTVVVLLYAGLHLYPQLLFAHSFSQDGITVYAREALPPEVADRVREIAELVDGSELAAAERNHRVFLCNDPWLFRFFAPFSPGSFAISTALTNNVFVADADLAANTARNRQATLNQRSFSGVAAHEITHGLIRARLGLLRASRIEDWVSEGYCDFVAQGGSYPEIAGLEILTSGGADESKSFQYFRWRKMVEYLIEDRELSFEDVVEMGSEAERVEGETIAALKARREPPVH